MEKGEIIGRGARAVVYALPDGRALKLYNPTDDPAFIKFVDYEAWLGRAIYDTGLPVPRVYEIINEDGAPGIIFERIEGQEMARELFAHPEKVHVYAAQMAELHAAIHTLSVPELPRAMNGLRRSLPRVRMPAEFADLGDIRGAALRALEGLADGDRLCHGDFHPLNVMMSPRGPVTIDWTSACLCAPVADVARTVLLLKTAPAFIDPNMVPPAIAEDLLARFLDGYLTRYLEINPLDADQLRAWELPLAVARLDENLPQEYSRLKQIIASHMG